MVLYLNIVLVVEWVELLKAFTRMLKEPLYHIRKVFINYRSYIDKIIMPRLSQFFPENSERADFEASSNIWQTQPARCFEKCEWSRSRMRQAGC